MPAPDYLKKYTVVITGADHPTGLGTARSAKGKNIKIIGICSNTRSASCYSKVWDKIIYTDNDGHSYLNTLLALGNKLGQKGVLLPAQDEVVKLISENRKQMSRFYEFIIPEKDVVNTLLDKAAFHEWASQNGFLVPRTLIATSTNELKEAMGNINYPVVIKPHEKNDSWQKAGFNEKVLILKKHKDFEDVEQKLIKASKKLVIQEWIPGKDSNVYFCLSYFNKYGKKVATYTGRKLLQWPPLGGSTSIAVGERNDEIKKITTDYFEKIGFKGLGSLEFKKSEIDNNYYIIEPTVGRNDLQSYVAVSGGVNLTKMAIFDAVGERCKIKNKLRKALWIEDSSLVDSLRYNYKAKQISFLLCRSLINKNLSFGYFDLKDFGPFQSILQAKIRNRMPILKKNGSHYQAED
jgi:predicted ATP-grasp superfamily ATP-dependent carboligase